MDAAQSWLPALMARVEARLARLIEGHGELLAGDARATLQAGGKRLRPMLVLLCAGPEAGDRAQRAAAAIELIHMATLVHDDVLDAAPLRRGMPTVVATSGRARATAVGDLLLSRAFAELGEDGDAEGGEDQPAQQRRGSASDFALRLPQVELLARASVGLALGELGQRRDAFDVGISADRYRERCLLKTARLFECACLIGRVAAQPDPAAESLTVFGREIGLAFQLLDDVLDVAGPPERTGKARGTDLLDGTVTLPLIIARERDPELARLDLRGLDANTAEATCDRIAATGALGEVRAEARERVVEAKRVVAGAPGIDARQRELLALVADGVVERYA
jgi:geranylgeranyl pyrophosphate synthase